MGITTRGPYFFSIAMAVSVFVLFGWTDPALAATPHNVNGWAWSGNTGWISMNCEDPKPGFPAGDCVADGGVFDYGLDLDDTGNLLGWAWSTNSGWICFGSACDGAAGVPIGGTPTVDHYCPGNVPCALYDTGDGELHGWAYIISETDPAADRGWISLNCTDVDPNTASPRNCGLSDYNVEYDETDGEFYGYAWNSNQADIGDGWIQWACDAARPCVGLDWGVTSSWVASGWTDVKPIEGIYSPVGSLPAGSFLTQFNVTFTDFSAPDGSNVNCSFLRSDGSYISQVWPVTQRYSNEPEVTFVYEIPIGSPTVDGSGNPIVWQFASEPPALPFGCEIQGSPPAQKIVSNLIAVHSTAFTFTGPGGSLGSDSNRAKFCLDGNLGTDPDRAYFLNTVQCDVEGDLALTLLKAKGVEVEVLCSDNLDDDANLQADCAGIIAATEPDRNCRGITYLCIPHPSAPSSDAPLP